MTNLQFLRFQQDLVASRERRQVVTIVLLALVGSATAAAVWIAFFWPIEPIYPIYLDVAEQLRRGELPSTFFPIGYSGLISGWLKGQVELTLRVVHLGSLFGTWAIVAWIVLRTAKDHDVRLSQISASLGIWIAFWTIVVLFNPYFFVGLVRVSDSAVDIFLMAVLFFAALSARKAGLLNWTVAGLALGLFIVVRPNAISMISALFVVAWLVRAPSAGMIACVVLTGVTFFGFCWVLTGKPIFWSTNGGYNLFAGNNPYSFDWLKNNYNAEYSLADALPWCGVKFDNAYNVAEDDFVRCTLKFIKEDPGQFVALVLYKGYTMLFRPNLRLANTPVKVIAQYIVLVPSIVWWASFCVSKSFRKSLPGLTGFIFTAVYSVPFLITNADPRFRIPLDVVYAMSSLTYAFGDRESVALLGRKTA